jgi:hypothetical protein
MSIRTGAVALVAAIVLLGLAAHVGSGEITACLVASQPSPGGPVAPSSLQAEFAAGQLRADVTWVDNAQDETCYVLERKINSGPYDVIAVLSPDSTSYLNDGPYVQAEVVTYRVYAATGSARSAYSNTDEVFFPVVDPSPPPPTPTPVSSPTPTSPPTPSATPAPSPTPTLSPGPTPSSSATPKARRQGDIDCNGDIDSVDALLILRHVAGLSLDLPPDCPPLT